MEPLEAYIKQLAYYRDRPNKQEQKDIIDIYNIFKDRLGIKSSELFYYTLWKSGGINKILLDLFITKLNLSLYDFLNMVLEKNNNTYERFSYALETYNKYITKLELTETLINVKRGKIVPCDDRLVELLVEYGADSFFSRRKFSSGFRSFSNDKDFFRERSCFWCQKDRVLCKYLYNELKKTYNIKLNNIIHVTGSNGKGSTCAFLEYMLRANGYIVNKYTSPAIMGTGTEIVINGESIDSSFYNDCVKKVMTVYEKVINLEEYKKDVEYVLTHDRIGDMKTRTTDHKGVLIWSLIIPLMALAFATEKADFNIIEVVTGGLNDFTNIFSTEETAATVITNIRSGIGSNDGCMAIFNEKGEVENSNRSVAYHKSMLGKEGVPMIVANQSKDVLKEIRHVAKDKVKTETFEYGRDWLLKDIDENNFTLTIYNKTLKFKKSKTLFEKFQTLNTATALATLLKLEHDGKVKLDYNLLQQGIYNTKIIARPQRILEGAYKDFFGKKTEIIYGVVKLNKKGVESLENIIEEYPDYYNYFVYTSGNANALNSHEMYFFDFIKKQKNSKLIIYRKNKEIYEKIKQHLDDNKVKYVEKSSLSQALTYVKNHMDKKVRNRIFILCDSMKLFDRNIVYLNAKD